MAGFFQDSISIGGHTVSGKSPSNLFVARLARDEQMCGPGSGAGSLNWLKAAEGPILGGWEGGPRMGVTAQGDVLVTGTYQPTAQFGDFKLRSAGLEDGFAALLENDDAPRHHGEHFDRYWIAS